MADNECAVHDDGERGVKNVFGVVWAVVHTVNFQNNTSSRCRGATWSRMGTGAASDASVSSDIVSDVVFDEQQGEQGT